MIHHPPTTPHLPTCGLVKYVCKYINLCGLLWQRLCLPCGTVSAPIEEGREGEKEGGKKGEREGERKAERVGGKEGGKEGGREGGREWLL